MERARKEEAPGSIGQDGVSSRIMVSAALTLSRTLRISS